MFLIFLRFTVNKSTFLSFFSIPEVGTLKNLLFSETGDNDSLFDEGSLNYLIGLTIINH